MIKPRVYTSEEIEAIIKKLREKFPEITIIEQSYSDPKFIHLCQIIGTQKVDTIPISLYHTEFIHIAEAEQLIKTL
jgi:hypothetical protein